MVPSAPYLPFLRPSSKLVGFRARGGGGANSHTLILVHTIHTLDESERGERFLKSNRNETKI